MFLGAKFSSAYNTSTGASNYIIIVKNHCPPNFLNFPKLGITFKWFSSYLINTVQYVCVNNLSSYLGVPQGSVFWSAIAFVIYQ